MFGALYLLVFVFYVLKFYLIVLYVVYSNVCCSNILCSNILVLHIPLFYYVLMFFILMISFSNLLCCRFLDVRMNFADNFIPALCFSSILFSLSVWWTKGKVFYGLRFLFFCVLSDNLSPSSHAPIFPVLSFP